MFVTIDLYMWKWRLTIHLLRIYRHLVEITQTFEQTPAWMTAAADISTSYRNNSNVRANACVDTAAANISTSYRNNSNVRANACVDDHTGRFQRALKRSFVFEYTANNKLTELFCLAVTMFSRCHRVGSTGLFRDDK